MEFECNEVCLFFVGVIFVELNQNMFCVGVIWKGDFFIEGVLEIFDMLWLMVSGDII